MHQSNKIHAAQNTQTAWDFMKLQQEFKETFKTYFFLKLRINFILGPDNVDGSKYLHEVNIIYISISKY